MGKSNSKLGERMKWYEGQQTHRLMPLLPACCRIDGRHFHSFTRGMARPFDEKFSGMMSKLTEWLVGESGAVIGYTQSDEISLVWYSENPKTQIFCDGKTHKMVSLLASMASVYFNKLVADCMPEKSVSMPTFDCRVWSTPTVMEAANYLIWREQDATKNSISMAAQSVFSHKKLQGMHSGDMQEMLWKEHKINWNDYPDSFKRGSYFARRKSSRPFTANELKNLPEKHEARQNPDLQIERTDVVRLDMPILTQVSNLVEVIFEDAIPEKLSKAS